MNAIQPHLPPLSDRREDLAVLASYFLDRARDKSGNEHSLAEEVTGVLSKYDWPGTVRELESVLERAVFVSRSSVILPHAMPKCVHRVPRPRLISGGMPPNPTMDVVEGAYILWVLDSEGGNKTRVAKALGFDPSTLYRKLNRYGSDA
jgi:transcriptional regulator with PAS, ATPase and Fis domain